MNKTRGGIFLLLLATLFVGSGCGAVRARNAEPFGRHRMIETPTAEASVPASKVQAPEAPVESPVKSVKRVAIKKPARSRTVSSVKNNHCNCATKTQQGIPMAGADKVPWFCLFCVTQNVTK